MPEKDLIFSQLKETNKKERTLYMTFDENTSKSQGWNNAKSWRSWQFSYIVLSAEEKFTLLREKE